MNELQKVLMERDGLSSQEADDAISDARELMNEYLEDGDMESAYDVCMEEFGLESDYIMELLCI